MGKYTAKQFAPRMYPEWGELISDLSPEKQAQIFNAILKYPNEDVDSGVWRFIKSQIDKDYTEFLERANKNKEIIQNYWKSKETIDNDGKRTLSNDEQLETNDNDGKPITKTETRTRTRTKTETETEIKINSSNEPNKYAFEGKIVKLNQKNFDEWKKAYPNLNLYAELLQRDRWLQKQPEDAHKNWFMSTSQYFIKQDALRKAQNSELAEQYGQQKASNDDVCWF